LARLILRDLNKVFENGVHAVKDFNLDIEDKEFVVFVGPSGCGKTTTLRMIAGLEDITAGEVFIDEIKVNDLPAKSRDIAMVFQNYALYPHMSVFENMAFGLKLRRLPKAEIKRRVDEAAVILGILPLLARKPKQLSGGQRQRVALGRALVREPKVFLMDEPLSNLDAKLRVQMRTEISKLHRRLATTFIYVTHDQVEAMTMGTRIVVMNEGEILQVATPQTIYERPVDVFVAGFIGSPPINFINGRLEEDGAEMWLCFDEHRVLIPQGKAKTLRGSLKGKDVIAGIRPENLHDELAFIEATDNSDIEVKVENTELMGAETYLYLKTSGIDLTARVNPRTKAEPGQTIRIALDMNRIHFFDPETELAIR
jgi:multiple sugar transport system ATP-binding protein